MAELTQSVVVCNLAGQVLLYNQRARLQFRALPEAPMLADGAELIGIGRSIYSVFERSLVAHALHSIHQRLAHGSANPSVQFVSTTRSGQLLRVQMAPVRAGEADTAARLSGFVLMLDNVMTSFAEESLRDQVLYGLTGASRSSLASTPAALNMRGYADLEPDMQARFMAVSHEALGTMSRRITDLAQRSSQGIKPVAPWKTCWAPTC
jgi:DNA polymerase-3 subunit epsilon